MRSIRHLLLRILCCISVACIGIGQFHGAGVLCSELANASLRRVQRIIPKLQLRAAMPHRFYSTGHQLYTIATYDAAFKYVLNNNEVRPSFLHSFVPKLEIIESERLDDHMNPVQSLQLLRTFLHSDDTEGVIKGLTPDAVYEVHRKDLANKRLERDEKATAFLHEMVSRFDEIKRSFPRIKYDGTMDFVCRLANNDYALVEMQVVPQSYWDMRALAYVAAFYGNQLFKGEGWKDIKKVIGINILGGGKDEKEHWVDTPTQFVRHYKVQEQLHSPARYIDGIEIIQYSLAKKAQKASKNKEQQDWLTFFRDAHSMTEEQVKQQIKTPAVLKAFELAKIKNLPAEVRAAYEAQDREFDRYAEHTASLVKEGELKGKMEGELKGKIEGEVKVLEDFIRDGTTTLEKVMQNTRLTPEVKAELAKRFKT